jgi:serine/threonine protein kinase
LNVLGETRAVKVIYRHRFADPRPFEREFEGIQRFEPISRSHPSQLAILHVGKNEAAGWFYYVMELADPVPMEGWLGLRTEGETAVMPERPKVNVDVYAPHTLRSDIEQNRRLPVQDCVRIGLSLTTALAHLHQYGLVHRDIKPSNVIFVNGVAKLGDIGLVTETGDTQSIVGTEGYLPPEGPGTPQADIFSLGKVLYEISTGMDRRRFPELPKDLRHWPDRKQVVEFNEILLKACAKESTRRYQSGDEMRSDLELLSGGKSIKRKRSFERTWRVTGRVVLAVALVLLIVLALFRTLGDGHVKPKDPETKKLMEQADYIADDPKRLAEATELYQKAITREPDFSPAWHRLFGVYFNGGNLNWNSPESVKAIARATLAKLEELAPNSAEYFTDSAITKWTDWKFQEALEDARRATQKREIWNDGVEYAHTIYGYYSLLSGQPDVALKEYQAAERLSAADAPVQHQLGHPYFVKGDLKEALEHYQASLKLKSDWGPGHHFSGLVFEERKDFLSAIKEFELSDRDFSNRTPEQTQRYFQSLRDAWLNGGEKRYWEKRLYLAMKDSPQDRYYIATLLARLSRRPEAYAWLRDACKHHAIGDVMFDRCWDHNDPEFQRIVRNIGLVR